MHVLTALLQLASSQRSFPDLVTSTCLGTRLAKMAAATRRLWSLGRVVAASRGYVTGAATGGEVTVKAPVQVFGIEGRYAHALFSAASKKKSLEKVEQELNDFQKLVAERIELRDFMKNPTLSKQQKQSSITGVLQAYKCSDLTVNLFAVLVANSRLPRALGVIKAFGTIMSAHRGEVPCTVTTAKPLDEKNKRELEKVLKEFLEEKQVLKLDVKIDSNIIGGLVVEIGDKFIDMSTSTKIRKIVQTLRETL